MVPISTLIGLPPPRPALDGARPADFWPVSPVWPGAVAAVVSSMADSTHERARASSSRLTVSGIITSITGVPPAATRSAAASISALTCML